MPKEEKTCHKSAKRLISVCSLPSPALERLELVVEPYSFLDVRKRQNGAPGQLEVLIQWKNLPPFGATWEDFELLISQFLGFHLEDKVHAWEWGVGSGGRIDKPPIRFTYARRKAT